MKDYVAVVKRKDSDELKHWKYIKREKVNGKWRYYYDIKDALGYDERQAAGQAIYDYEKAQNDYKKAMDYSHDEFERLVDKRGGLDPYTGNNKLTDNDKKYLDELQTTYLNKDKEVVAAGKKVTEALDKYYKTPLGKIDRLDDYIDAGRNKLSKLLSSLSNKIKPKKESLTQYRK